MVSISFIGDISLNDNYIQLRKLGIKPFAELENVLEKSDLVVGNLECLAAGNQGENLEKRPRLKTDIPTLGYLKDINLGLASLAHNHVYDNLEDGFLRTLDFLQKSGIRHMGATVEKGSVTEAGSGLPQVIEMQGIRFAFFNYVSGDTNPSLPPETGIRLSLLEKDTVIRDLNNAGDVDYKVLLLHWGGRYENSYYPGPDQISMAKEFIEAGADLIIGHHPHTLQPSMIHRGKSVFFSLGNFCFADIHSDGQVKEIRDKRWLESAVLNVVFTSRGYETSFVPFRLDKLHTIIDQKVLALFRHRQAYFKLIRFSSLFWYIYYFGFKYLRRAIWELRKKDPERSFMKRLLGLNREKVRGLFR